MKVADSENFKQNIRINFCVFAKFFFNTNETKTIISPEKDVRFHSWVT